MSGQYESFANTPIGIALSDAIDTLERFSEFRALTEAGKPAVQAIARDVAPIIEALPTKKERDAASQFCGWYVAQIMRSSGYEIAQNRGRVSNAPYQTGAVWRQTDRAVQLVTARPPEAGSGRLELAVKQGDSGVVAEWIETKAVTSRTTGAVRKVHTISRQKPVKEACEEALAHAKRIGIPFVWITDPDHLFPKTDWPA
jgi:hypothetical protein